MSSISVVLNRDGRADDHYIYRDKFDYTNDDQYVRLAKLGL